MKKPVYINRDERYGDAEIATLDDYHQMNPRGIFEEREDGIYERVKGNEWVLIAELIEGEIAP